LKLGIAIVGRDPCAWLAKDRGHEIGQRDRQGIADNAKQRIDAGVERKRRWA